MLILARPYALQVIAIDFQALTLAGVACLLPPLEQLNRHKAEPVSSAPTFILLSFMAALAAAVQVVDLVIIMSQAWCTGGTGTPYSVSTNLAMSSCIIAPVALPRLVSSILAVSSCMTCARMWCYPALPGEVWAGSVIMLKETSE